MWHFLNIKDNDFIGQCFWLLIFWLRSSGNFDLDGSSIAAFCTSFRSNFFLLELYAKNKMMLLHDVPFHD